MYSSDAKNVDLRTGLDGHHHGFLSASGMWTKVALITHHRVGQSTAAQFISRLSTTLAKCWNFWQVILQCFQTLSPQTLSPHKRLWLFMFHSCGYSNFISLVHPYTHHVILFMFGYPPIPQTKSCCIAVYVCGNEPVVFYKTITLDESSSLIVSINIRLLQGPRLP